MKLRRTMVLLALSAALAAAAPPAAAQLVLGQYEDEAPFRTWNSFPFAGAAALGRGDTVLACGADALAGLANPALLLRLPRFSLSLEGGLSSATMSRFAYINTGVVSSSEPLSRAAVGIDGIAAAWHFGNWAFSLAAAEYERYDRPSIQIENQNAGWIYYANDFTQTGSLRGVSFAAALKLGPRLSLGLSVVGLWGTLDRSSSDQWNAAGFTITDQVTQKFTGYSFQGGIVWDPAAAITLAATVRSPYLKKSDSLSVLRYHPVSGEDIVIRDSAGDSLRQPWVVGFGAAVRPNENLTLSADAVYYGWSRYAPSFFGDVQDRGFRDVVRLGIGVEYRGSFRLFGHDVISPGRVGLLYDPQPMKTPRSFYMVFAFGTGLYWDSIHLDLGASLGHEAGSGQGLTTRRVALSLAVLFGERS